MVLQRCRVFLFLYAGPTGMAGGARDNSTPGSYSLILMGRAGRLSVDDAMSWHYQQVITSHPAPVGGVADQGADPRPYREQTTQ